MHLMGSKKTPWNIQGASKTFKCEPSGSKNCQREQGDVHGQPRVLQNDPKDSKSELQGTSNSKKLILNNQKRHLIHFQPTVHPRLQESNYRLKVGGRGEACKYIIYIYKMAGSSAGRPGGGPCGPARQAPNLHIRGVGAGDILFTGFASAADLVSDFSLIC